MLVKSRFVSSIISPDKSCNFFKAPRISITTLCTHLIPLTGPGNPRETQYRAFLLLKALQTVARAFEVERGQRAARGGQDGPGRGLPCRLYSLTVSLERYLVGPTTATINNCHGVCGFPLINGNNHAILLNSQIQSGMALERSLCCVPVDYEDLEVAELNEEGTTISIKPNMVAKECGCR